jgi:hypothetical protein
MHAQMRSYACTNGKQGMNRWGQSMHSAYVVIMHSAYAVIMHSAYVMHAQCLCCDAQCLRCDRALTKQ